MVMAQGRCGRVLAAAGLALVPAFWLVALGTAIWTSARAGNAQAWAQWALVLIAPGVLLIGMEPRCATGRLTTGTEPAPAATPSPGPY